MKRIGSIYGLDTLVFCIRNFCDFFSNQMQCKFCGMKTTYERHRAVEFQKKISQIKETVTKAIELDAPTFISLTSGSLWNHDREVKLFVDTLHAIRSATGWSRIRGAAITMPPDNFKWIDFLYDTGIEHVCFNLEIYDPALFAEICPGKALYGRHKYFEAFKYAVDVFGEGNVWSDFVVGLEPLSSLKKVLLGN